MADHISEQMQYERVRVVKEELTHLEATYENVKNRHRMAKWFMGATFVFLLLDYFVFPFLASIYVSAGGSNGLMGRIVLGLYSYLGKWTYFILPVLFGIATYRCLLVRDPIELDYMRFHFFEERYMMKIHEKKKVLKLEEQELEEILSERIAYQENQTTQAELEAISSTDVFDGDESNVEENEQGEPYISLEDVLNDLREYDAKEKEGEPV